MQLFLRIALLCFASAALSQPFDATADRPVADHQRPGYQRTEWQHWEDFDGDCQNARQELLIAQSQLEIRFTNARSCTVATGLWFDPYTGLLFSKASDVDIDHVIPLQYAHDHGGAPWSPLLKKLFANDPENLLIVDDGENQRKSAKGPADYLPRFQYQCEYASKWQGLARKYELQLAHRDTLVLERILLSCKAT